MDSIAGELTTLPSACLALPDFTAQLLVALLGEASNGRSGALPDATRPGMVALLGQGVSRFHEQASMMLPVASPVAAQSNVAPAGLPVDVLAALPVDVLGAPSLEVPAGLPADILGALPVDVMAAAAALAVAANCRECCAPLSPGPSCCLAVMRVSTGCI